MARKLDRNAVDNPGTRTSELALPLQKAGLLRAGRPTCARSWVTARGLAQLEGSELSAGLDVLDALRVMSEDAWT